MQRYFTRRLFSKKGFSYAERLFLLEIESLEVRRIKFDLIMCYKIVKELVDLNPNDFSLFAPNSSTRGHNFKMVKRLFRINSLFNCFANQVVNCWNSLFSDIVNAASITAFKMKLCSVDLSSFCAEARC